ncbi:DUF4383 domain-containing protein [Actinotalea sp. AC32]|nr:DUF4383 domain-containing protein [Actinotalea sp. AC32]
MSASSRAPAGPPRQPTTGAHGAQPRERGVRDARARTLAEPEGTPAGRPTRLRSVDQWGTHDAPDRTCDHDRRLLAIGYGATFVYGLIVVDDEEANILDINAADDVLHAVSALAGLASALWPDRDRARGGV